MGKRRNYSPKSKARSARAAVEDNATIADSSQPLDVHRSRIIQWERTALDRLPTERQLKVAAPCR